VLNKFKIIAEAGENHNWDIKLSKELKIFNVKNKISKKIIHLPG